MEIRIGFASMFNASADVDELIWFSLKLGMCFYSNDYLFKRKLHASIILRIKRNCIVIASKCSNPSVKTVRWKLIIAIVEIVSIIIAQIPVRICKRQHCHLVNSTWRKVELQLCNNFQFWFISTEWTQSLSNWTWWAFPFKHYVSVWRMPSWYSLEKGIKAYNVILSHRLSRMSYWVWFLYATNTNLT